MGCSQLTSCILVVVVGVAVFGTSPSNAQGWTDLLPALTSQIGNLWQNSELEFLGNSCFYVQKPKFRRWELYFYGTFSCPGWTSIRGKSRTRSQSGAMGDAVENFLIQARDRGIVTPEEAHIWLEGFQK